MMRNRLYYHIWAPENKMSRQIIDEQMLSMMFNGVLDHADLKIGILGKCHREIKDYLLTFPKYGYNFEILYDKPDTEFCEIETLSYLQDHVRQLQHNIKVGYLHTKGLSWVLRQVSSQPNNSWRLFLQHHTITNHQFCIETLDNYDTCGPARSSHLYEHYSGNFWWANSDYLKTLIDVWEHAADLPVPLFGNQPRYRAESWLLSSKQGIHADFGHYGRCPYDDVLDPLFALKKVAHMPPYVENRVEYINGVPIETKLITHKH